MGNTMGIDMGNTFHFISRPFRGHVVEKTVRSGASAEVCESGVEGPPKHGAIVSVVWIESQDWLQMEGSLRVGRPTRTARPDSPSGPFAEANFARVVDSNSSLAPKASQLGQSETGGSIAQGISALQDSVGADDWQVAQTFEVESAWPAKVLARPQTEPQKIDNGDSEQPCMDGGLQGLVPNPGWSTGGTLDGAGCIQLLSAEHPAVEKSELERGEASFSGVVSAIRISPGHSNGQRGSLWYDRSGWAFAPERLVGQFGDSSRIHSAWAAAAERSARADASSVEGGDNPAGFDSPASSATANGPLGEDLQPSPTSRRLGTAGAGANLPSEAFAGKASVGEIFQGTGGAACEKQWRDQMARAQAICGRSICRLPGRAQEGEQGRMPALFCGSSDRSIVGFGSWGNSSIQVPTAELSSKKEQFDEEKSPGRKEAALSRWSPLRFGSLRSPPLRGLQRESIPACVMCYPCVCSECYPCVCPLPTLVLPLRLPFLVPVKFCFRSCK